MQWKEGGVPLQDVFEVLAPGNRPGEMHRKFLFYQQYGVEEYYIYDPDDGSLKGWRRVGNRLKKIRKMAGFVSPRLGIKFDPGEGPDDLKIFGPDGKKFLTYAELFQQSKADQRRAAEERQRARAADQRAEEQSRVAEAERQRVEEQTRIAVAERQRAEMADQRAEEQARVAEAERQRVEEQTRVAEAERQRAEVADQRAEEQARLAMADRQRADEERQRASESLDRAERLAARLRELGIEPE